MTHLPALGVLEGPGGGGPVLVGAPHLALDGDLGPELARQIGVLPRVPEGGGRLAVVGPVPDELPPAGHTAALLGGDPQAHLQAVQHRRLAAPVLAAHEVHPGSTDHKLCQSGYHKTGVGWSRVGGGGARFICCLDVQLSVRQRCEQGYNRLCIRQLLPYKSFCYGIVATLC